jgi:hypothetical protein
MVIGCGRDFEIVYSAIQQPNRGRNKKRQEFH